jgi:hypothetical protein
MALSCKSRDPSAAATFDAAPADAGEEERILSTSPARRCGECHGALEDEWRESAHRRAEISPAYVAMSGRAHDDTCQTCHAPIARFVGADSPMRGEGVTCDACHAMRAADATKTGGTFTLELGDNTKYGPLCDAKNHYFHKVKCSPLHGQARQCGACHLLWRPIDGGAPLPVFTEYEEWAASSFGGIGVECQDCHMPGTAGELAVGAGKRPAVSHHGFMGSTDLRKRAVDWSVVVSGDDRAIHAAVTLKNVGAGHSIPTGIPGRRLTLRARVVDSARVESEDERTYARIVVDESGVEVPFYLAVRVASDNRLPAGETRTETFDLAAAGPGRLELELVETAMSPAQRAELALPAEPDFVLLTTNIPFGAARGGGRALLPKSLNTTADP